MSRRTALGDCVMRKLLRKLAPSMFYRRLLLLSAAAMGVVILLVSQAFRLTVVHGAQSRDRAESALRQVRHIPTRRGLILDRKQRVLAEDDPGYDISVSYDVLTHEWAHEQARKLAAKENAQRWRELGYYGRERLASEHESQFNQQIEDMWSILADLGDVDGETFEQQRKSTIRWVQRQASHTFDARRRRAMQELDEPVELSQFQQPIVEQTMAHPVLFDVNDQARTHVLGLIAEAKDNQALAVWREVEVDRSQRRVYPNQTFTVALDRRTLPGPLKNEKPVNLTVQGVGVHLIGSMRRIWKEDVHGDGTPENPGRPFHTTDRRGNAIIDLGGYQLGDQTGQWGIEKSQERVLRGARGRVIRYLDTGDEDRIEPTPGRNGVLSVDIQLQARITAIMHPDLGLMKRQRWHTAEPFPYGPEGEALNGAAVVLDVSRSEVLAAVSAPGFTMEQLRDDPDSVIGDPINRPFVNRVTAMPYQPGSTIKPLVLTAAISDGVLGLHEPIDCHGQLYPNQPKPRCWIFKHHGGLTHNSTTGGPLTGDQAICHSCNIFFYTLGKRFGGRRLIGWYDRFGLGKTSSLELSEQVRGDLPDLARLQTDPNTPGFADNDAVFMGIGQGPVRWTPIQAAAAYAAIARGGYYIRPTLLHAGADDQESYDLRLDPRSIDLALKGLHDAVNLRQGTGHHITFGPGQRENIFNIDGVELYGKSGTADPAPLRIDSDGDGRITRKDAIVKTGDHAWMICLVRKPGSTRPDYVVAVVAAYAGSGGRVSGPIVNQILHAMRAEGYL